MHYKKYKSILTSSKEKLHLNIYRGCTHGCIYCDTRSKCYQFSHPLEDVEVKEGAPAQFLEELKHKRKKKMISTGSMCDPYTHCEADLQYTRQILHHIYNRGFGVSILTKSDMILRDLDILKKINEKTKCVVQVTLTTFNDNLCKIIEPNVAVTSKRIEVLKIMKENKIPCIVWLNPFLPFINDNIDNLMLILKACIEAKVYGIICFDIGLTLREGNREYFYEKLDIHFPGMKEKYQQIYQNSYVISSPNRQFLMNLFRYTCQKYGIVCDINQIFTYLETFEDKSINVLFK